MIRLIAITDTSVAPAEVLLARLRSLAKLCQPGSLAVQLRDHALCARARFELGRRIQALGLSLIVNDRIDLALALGANALHLGERSVALSDARRLWSGCVMRARHDLAALESELADAVVLSPILGARHARPALGSSALSEARARLPARVRLYALGGIDAQSARRCLDAGADGVAAIGAVFSGGDLRPLCAALGITRSAAVV